MTWLDETTWFRTPVSALPTPEARLLANIQATGKDGGHDLHYRTLQAMGVELVGRLTGVDGHQARFADDLADSVAWGDARYADIGELLAAQLGDRAPHWPDPPPFRADPTARARPPRVRRGDLHVRISPRLRRLGPAAGVRPHGLPYHRRRGQHGRPGLYFCGVHFLRTRASSLLFGVGEDASVVAHAAARRLR